MATPTENAMEALKRLARYLIKKPRLVFVYGWQGRENEVRGYSDSDWVGCKVTGKSTSGGCVLRGAHYIKGWSTTQQCVTLSSAEAELVAMNKTAAEVLGILSMYSDLGEQGRRPHGVDSSRGLGLPDPGGAESLMGVIYGEFGGIGNQPKAWMWQAVPQFLRQW